MTNEKPGKLFVASLWVSQFALAFVFFVSGYGKAFLPFEALEQALPYTADMPHWFIRFVGFADLAGAIGVVLPALTRILPKLTVWAAAGVGTLAACALAWRVFGRGEVMVFPVFAVLILLALYVIWGRTRKAPIQPRTFKTGSGQAT